MTANMAIVEKDRLDPPPYQLLNFHLQNISRCCFIDFIHAATKIPAEYITMQNVQIR